MLVLRMVDTGNRGVCLSCMVLYQRLDSLYPTTVAECSMRAFHSVLEWFVYGL